ncbi:TPA: ATP-dependent DNA ligase [Candidatus Dojkabacteria bacterium]|uniref:DNA ligase (ATP) n=1 Tax=Candidatus Dojkabacteria bacterium TaxID=2099670 RepID=A0A832QCE0_9BACT|nr:ATP-dependent DNA ligase [Candidatus Dojkabacteria bacterium]
MDFNEVANIFEQIEKTNSRNEITSILADFYKELNKEEGQIIAYMILGRVAPFFLDSEFNYSEKSLLTLLENFSKLHLQHFDVNKKRIELGDIGDTVKELSEQAAFSSKKLSVKETYEILWNIVNIQGTGSVERKNSIVLDIIQKLSPLEAKYFVRIICGELRFGINYKTLLDVFSFVISGSKSVREELDRAYGVSTDIGYIYSVIAKKSEEKAIESLKNVKLQPGIPVLPRLVERVGSFEETFDRTGVPALIQPKFDGLRCQIHKYKEEGFEKREYIWKKYIQKESVGLFDMESDGVQVKLFTRNLEDVTKMFPEIVESAKQVKDTSFILDSEALGFKDGKFLPFQETMQRRRKYGVEDTSKDIPVKAMIFDVLYLKGKDLIGTDTKKRIEILEKIKMDGSLEVCETKKVEDLDSLMDIFNENVEKGYEGVIAKMETGGYLPGARNYDWIKLKKSMLSSLVDTVDLVCVGYYHGSGRRSDLGVGAILGALYNEETDGYEAICKVGTGFTDEQLRSIKEQLESQIEEDQPKSILCPENLKPDVWVYPEVVFTVEADEITRRLGEENVGGGLSLRFPRLVEWDRDKSANDATRVSELEKMYNMSKN